MPKCPYCLNSNKNFKDKAALNKHIGQVHKMHAGISRLKKKK